MKTESIAYIKEQLCRIACARQLDPKFGEPFIEAFSSFMPDETEKVTVASYTCSLFLSAILNGFPTIKLHTFVHFTKEHFQRFSFNCRMYDNIFSYMRQEELEHVVLLDKEGNSTVRQCTRQDIFEAFDFYTNG